jgi:S1-C subfamily serine protease
LPAEQAAIKGIGFAIPVAMAREVMDQLIKTGKVTRGYMGAGIQDVTPALARAFKLPNASGAAITHVEPGSPAARGGLQAGDVVTAVNGEDVIDSPALRLRISRTAPGTPVKLTVQRAEGQREVTVNLGTLPDDNEGAWRGARRPAGRRLEQPRCKVCRWTSSTRRRRNSCGSRARFAA